MEVDVVGFFCFVFKQADRIEYGMDSSDFTRYILVPPANSAVLLWKRYQDTGQQILALRFVWLWVCSDTFATCYFLYFSRSFCIFANLEVVFFRLLNFHGATSLSYHKTEQKKAKSCLDSRC
jgi:hypothetical protein